MAIRKNALYVCSRSQDHAAALWAAFFGRGDAMCVAENIKSSEFSHLHSVHPDRKIPKNKHLAQDDLLKQGFALAGV